MWSILKKDLAEFVSVVKTEAAEAVVAVVATTAAGEKNLKETPQKSLPSAEFFLEATLEESSEFCLFKVMRHNVVKLSLFTIKVNPYLSEYG